MVYQSSITWEESFIHSFIHSICMCRMWLFLAILRSFFHSPLLCTFLATLLHQLFFHPLSPHLAIYFLVYLSIPLFPNEVMAACNPITGSTCKFVIKEQKTPGWHWLDKQLRWQCIISKTTPMVNHTRICKTVDSLIITQPTNAPIVCHLF